MELNTWKHEGQILPGEDGGYYSVCAHTDCDYTGTTWTERANAEDELEDHEREVAGKPLA